MFRRAVISAPTAAAVATLFSAVRAQSGDAKQKKAAGGAAASSSVNNVTLVGVVHDIQTGYVYEDRVTQFVVTTTSIDTTNPAQECVVEKDHHTVRCYGDAFAEDVRGRIKEGAVVCVSGRLRLNPQLEPTCGRHFYFPFLHVAPPHGGVALVHGDRRKPPQTVSAPIPTAASSSTASSSSSSNTETSSAAAAAAAATESAAAVPLDEKPQVPAEAEASSAGAQAVTEAPEPKAAPATPAAQQPQ